MIDPKDIPLGLAYIKEMAKRDPDGIFCYAPYIPLQIFGANGEITASKPASFKTRYGIYTVPNPPHEVKED